MVISSDFQTNQVLRIISVLIESQHSSLWQPQRGSPGPAHTTPLLKKTFSHFRVFIYTLKILKPLYCLICLISTDQKRDCSDNGLNSGVKQLQVFSFRRRVTPPTLSCYSLRETAKVPAQNSELSRI